MKTESRGLLVAGALVAGVAATVGTAQGGTLDLSFSVASSPYAATADFHFDDVLKTLTVTLSNNGVANDGSANYQPFLTGLFWNMTGVTIDSATGVAAATPVWKNNDNNGNFVAYGGSLTPANQWCFKDGLTGNFPSGNPANFDYALSCVGAGLFGGSDLIDGNGALNNAPNGDDGAIIPTGQTTVGGKKDYVFYKGSAVFSFALDTFNVSNVAMDGVKFGWGSEFQVEMSTVVVPLPAPVLMAGIGLLGVVGLRRWRRNG